MTHTYLSPLITQLIFSGLTEEEKLGDLFISLLSVNFTFGTPF